MDQRLGLWILRELHCLRLIVVFDFRDIDQTLTYVVSDPFVVGLNLRGAHLHLDVDLVQKGIVFAAKFFILSVLPLDFLNQGPRRHLSLLSGLLQQRLIFDLLLFLLQSLYLLSQILFVIPQLPVLLLDDPRVFILRVRHLDIPQLFFQVPLWLVLRSDLEPLHRDGNVHVVFKGSFIFRIHLPDDYFVLRTQIAVLMRVLKRRNLLFSSHHLIYIPLVLEAELLGVDQVQDLFSCPADIFIIVIPLLLKQIPQEVIELLLELNSVDLFLHFRKHLGLHYSVKSVLYFGEFGSVAIRKLILGGKHCLRVYFGAVEGLNEGVH